MSTRSFLVNLIDGCSSIACFKQIHAKLVISGTTRESQVVERVIGFFRNSRDLQYSCRFLSQIQCEMGSFPINSMITAYAGTTTPDAAIVVYRMMVRYGFSPDLYTFPVLLKSCAKVLGIDEGKQFHGQIFKTGLAFDLYVQNALVHMYGVCKECDYAYKMFTEMPLRDVVSWTSLISGYVKAALFDQALLRFSKMDIQPNAATLVSVLVACGRMGDLRLGKEIHGLVFKLGFELGLLMGNALIDMYVKCMRLDEAKLVFYELPERDAISWTSMISGLVQCKHPREALEFFHTMQVSGTEPDKVTLASVLSACASVGALDCGRWVHEYVDRKGIEWDAHMGTAMIDMYAKCGSIEMALRTFHETRHKNIFTWNALLGGLAMHGHGKDALDLFEEMLGYGLRPNEITFLAVLTACCHSGLVNEGRGHFHQMIDIYNLSPRIEHFGCMVDLLCRAGLLEEAQVLIKTMPMPPDVLIWGALLSACKAKGDVVTSHSILSHLLEMESDDSGVYVLLSNIYASNDRWEDAARVRRLMKYKGIKKHPGSSVVEVDGKIHEFLAGDANRPQQDDIDTVLNMLAKQVYLEGHNLNPLSCGMKHGLDEYEILNFSHYQRNVFKM